MRIIVALLLASCAGRSYAQSNLPVIKAGDRNALILEGDDRYSWQLSPEVKPDIFTINKSPKGRQVRFCTDTDTISTWLKPGAKFDFLVIYKDKDSCYTRLESPSITDYSKLQPVQHDTIPFILTSFNNIKMKAVLNGTDTLDLKFDSGATGLLLTRDAIKNKTKVQRNNEAIHSLQIGAMRWDKQRIYPVELSGQGTDGRFGWDLFDGKVVEIDYDHNLFIVHSRLPARARQYAAFPINYTHSLFTIVAELQIKDRKFKGPFLFDNGYQRTAMLDTTLIREQAYPQDLPVIKKVIMKNGQGEEVPVITVDNEQMNLGKHKLRHIPAQLMTMANPAGFKTHILGNEILKRFNTLLDFQDNVVYLVPNHLYNQPYADAQ